jgi:hypothetical protein
MGHLTLALCTIEAKTLHVVTWNSKKQHAISLSSTEAKYQGTVKGSCEIVWLGRMLSDMKKQ